MPDSQMMIGLSLALLLLGNGTHTLAALVNDRSRGASFVSGTYGGFKRPGTCPRFSTGRIEMVSNVGDRDRPCSVGLETSHECYGDEACPYPLKCCKIRGHKMCIEPASMYSYHNVLRVIYI